MFRFLCSRRLFRAKGTSLFFNGNPTKTPATPVLCFLHIRSISISTTDNSKCFTVSYLMNSCGLSKEKAISASKNINLKSTKTPDSVLALFKNHDFPKTQISIIIGKIPSLLLYNADETLQPKFEFLKNSIGFSNFDLANFIAKDPYILTQSLENTLRPAIIFLKSIVGSDNSNITTVLRRSTWVYRQHPKKGLEPNIAFLRAYGVPDYNISKILLKNPRALGFSANRFNEIIEEIQKMKIDLSKYGFVQAFVVLAGLRKSSLQAKLNIYKRFGWSEDEIFRAFRCQPRCIELSEKKIIENMELLVNKMGWDPLFIVKDPIVLMYSLEKRIIPRFSVIEVLISNGFLRKDFGYPKVLKLSGEKFLQEFVTKFEEKVPELLNVYQGKIKCLVSAH